MIKSSKAIPASKTEIGKIYKLDGVHRYLIRTTHCATIRPEDEGLLFMSMHNGVISKFPADTMFKPCQADITIDD